MGNSWPVIARTAPGYGSIATIDETKREFSEQSPLFSVPTFPKPIPLPELALITARSYSQHGEVVYKEAKIYGVSPIATRS